VTSETRSKVQAVLRDAAIKGVSQRRQVNHLSAEGPDIPVSYTAVRMGDEGLIVAVGRDMRAISVLQQRLVETQQAMERDYWRLRHVETRYRLLFQLATDAVLVVDAATRKIVDANAAAAQLFGMSEERLTGRAFPMGTDAAGTQALQELMAHTRNVGRGGDVSVKVGTDAREVTVSASCFRQEAATLFLIRFLAPAGAAQAPRPAMDDLVAHMPDAFVVTDAEGRVISANHAFLDLAQLGSEQHARDRLISDWLGRPGADLAMLLTLLRRHGSVRMMATSARGEMGTSSEVEVSASLVSSDDAPRIGFMIRDVGRRVVSGPRGVRDLTQAVEHLTQLVGRVTLPELLRDTVDLVERHFISAALEQTQDNRTVAAEVLGLSRQSLYLKLRRYRLLAAEAAEEAS
jgi:transcriptional regulator PpsR